MQSDHMKAAIRQARLENAELDAALSHTKRVRKDNVHKLMGMGMTMGAAVRAVEVGLQRLYPLPWDEPRADLIAEIMRYRARADGVIAQCRVVLTKCKV